jgi:hypothetical protein
MSSTFPLISRYNGLPGHLNFTEFRICAAQYQNTAMEMRREQQMTYSPGQQLTTKVLN